MIKKALMLIFAVAVFAACDKEQYPMVLPEPYLPAYPESYWVYTNGETVTVSPGYHEVAYDASLGLSPRPEFVLAPMIGADHVLRYQITQNSTRVPLRRLLDPAMTTAWLVDHWQDRQVMRRVQSFDTTLEIGALIYPGAQVFDSVIMVVEYIEGDTLRPWVYRESYAPGVGLLRREMHGPDGPVVEKELVRYHINK